MSSIDDLVLSVGQVEAPDTSSIDKAIYSVGDDRQFRRVSSNGRWQELDDDTIVDLHTGIHHRIAGVDAPEKAKHWKGVHGHDQGATAGALFDLLDRAGDNTEIRIFDTGDRHGGRQVSRFMVGGKDVSEYLIENNYAGRAFDKDDHYLQAEDRAFFNPNVPITQRNPTQQEWEQEIDAKTLLFRSPLLPQCPEPWTRPDAGDELCRRAGVGAGIWFTGRGRLGA